jgi:hypothetical protein
MAENITVNTSAPAKNRPSEFDPYPISSQMTRGEAITPSKRLF